MFVHGNDYSNGMPAIATQLTQSRSASGFVFHVLQISFLGNSQAMRFNYIIHKQHHSNFSKLLYPIMRNVWVKKKFDK